MTRALTVPQLAALRLAEKGALRYFKGGSYTNEALGGSDPRKSQLLGWWQSCAIGTIRALVARGLLFETLSRHFILVSAAAEPTIYDRRWEITEAGRAAVKERT